MAKKPKSLIKSLLSSYVNVCIFLGLLVLAYAGVVVVVVLNKPTFPYMLTVGILGLILLILVIIVISLHHKFSNDLYQSASVVFTKNLEQLVNNKKEFALITNGNKYEEFEKINNIFIGLRETLLTHSVAGRFSGYDGVDLNYMDEETGLVEYSSLVDNLDQLLLRSYSFMNALVDISFKPDERGNVKELDDQLDAISTLLDYPDRLFAIKPDRTGFVIYIPCFDSINQLKEEFEYVIKQASILVKSPTGKKFALPTVGVVIYPYSESEDMFDDLEKAKKGKEFINIYIPEKVNSFNREMLSESTNLNKVGYLLEQASTLRPEEKFRAANYEKIKKLISLLCDYYSFDGAGLIRYDEVKDQYMTDYAYCHNFFGENLAIDPEFAQAISDHMDDNRSYYFSNRKHTNVDISRYLDLYLITSGHFYIIEADNQIIGILYFLNEEREINYDSYLRENLLTFSCIVGKFISQSYTTRLAEVNQKKFDEVLKYSGSIIYSVNKEDLSLTYVSEAFKQIKDVKLGKKCYEAIYGLSEPCDGCPLKTLQHMVSKLTKDHYDSHVVFKNSQDKEAHIRLTEVDKNSTPLDMFDEDLLIPSFVAFKNRMKGAFMLGDHGYSCYLTLANSSELLSTYGLDGYNELLKNYIHDLEKLGVELYKVTHNVFGLLLSESSQKEVAAKLSELHEVSEYFGIDVAYTAKAYPNGYETAEQYLIDALKFITSYKVERRANTIYIDDIDYIRFANKIAYISSLLEKQAEAGDLEMLYTPMLNNLDRYIHAASILPVIKDNVLDIVIPTEEALDAISKAGKFDLLTNTILDSLDKVLTKYGYGFFVSAGIDHLIIPAEYSFFEGWLLENVIALISKFNLKKDFIMLETSEDDVCDNIRLYKQHAKEIRNSGVGLSMSHYTGDIVSPEYASALGFSNVKFAKELSSKVTSSENALNTILSVWKDISKHNIQASFDGIINREQADLIYLDKVSCNVSGSYFIAPKDIVSFIMVVKERNRNDDSFSS